MLALAARVSIKKKSVCWFIPGFKCICCFYYRYWGKVVVVDKTKGKLAVFFLCICSPGGKLYMSTFTTTTSAFSLVLYYIITLPSMKPISPNKIEADSIIGAAVEKFILY
jgi:hypothetical protein